MSRRRPQEERLRKVPISVTLDRGLYDFVEDLIDRRIAKDRSHAINMALDFLKWKLDTNPTEVFGQRPAPQRQPPVPQRPRRDPRLPR